MTSRLLLRLLRREDAVALSTRYAHDRAHFEPWLGTLPTTVPDAMATIAELIEEARLGRQFTYGVFNDGDLIGSVQLGIQDDGQATLGYWIAHDRWGSGLATEASSAIAHAAFATRRISSLTVTCDPRNVASVRVAERVGFHFAEPTHGVGVATAANLALAPPLDAVDGRGHRLVLESAATVERHWRALRGGLLASFAGSVPVVVTLVDAVGEPAVVFSARVARENAIAPQDLLRHNASLAVGAVCIIDGQCVLRHVTPLASLSLAWAIRAVELLDHEARRLAHGLTPEANLKMFSSFAE